MQQSNPKKIQRKPQSQLRPGDENKMKPRPVFKNDESKGSGKLMNKISLVTGGDRRYF